MHQAEHSLQAAVSDGQDSQSLLSGVGVEREILLLQQLPAAAQDLEL